MNWKRLYAALLPWLVAVSAALMLSGCVASGSAPVGRALPAVPPFAKPVATPDPKEGEDLLVVAARERAGRVQANRVITAFRDWYAGVRRRYEAKD